MSEDNINPCPKYGVNNSLCDMSGNTIYTYGINDDWLLWELSHSNDVNMIECLEQKQIKM